MQTHLGQDKKGFAALMVVVVIGVAALIMVLGSTFLGVGEAELGFVADKADETYSIADGCVEAALLQLRLDPAYSGGSLSLGDGSCILSVLSDGADRTVLVTSTVQAYNTRLHVEATLTSSTVSVTSWTEIPL